MYLHIAIDQHDPLLRTIAENTQRPLHAACSIYDMPPYVGLHFFYIRGLFLLSVPIEAVYAAFFSPCMALFGELKMRSSGRCINNNRGLSPRLPELQQNRFVELPNLCDKKSQNLFKYTTRSVRVQSVFEKNMLLVDYLYAHGDFLQIPSGTSS